MVTRPSFSAACFQTIQNLSKPNQTDSLAALKSVSLQFGTLEPSPSKLFPNSTSRWLPQKVQLVSSILHLVNRKPLIKYDQRLFSWAFRCESLVSKSSISLCNLGHEFVSGFQPMTCVVSLSTILASCVNLVRVRRGEVDQTGHLPEPQRTG